MKDEQKEALLHAYRLLGIGAVEGERLVKMDASAPKLLAHVDSALAVLLEVRRSLLSVATDDGVAPRLLRPIAKSGRPNLRLVK